MYFVVGDPQFGHEVRAHLQRILLRFLKLQSNLVGLEGVFVVIHVFLLASFIVKADGEQRLLLAGCLHEAVHLVSLDDACLILVIDHGPEGRVVAAKLLLELADGAIGEVHSLLVLLLLRIDGAQVHHGQSRFVFDYLIAFVVDAGDFLV